MDVLFVIGAMLGLDGMELSPARSKELLAAACAAGTDLACDGSWHAHGRVDLAALAASARPRCEAKDPVGCAALGMAETRTAVGGLARTAPTWDAGRVHLAEACAAGVARACTEDSRIVMLLDPATTPEAVDLAPHRQLAAGCAAGEPVACLLSAEINENGWGGKVDAAAGAALRAKACEAGVPSACPTGGATADRLAALCAAGSRSACVALVESGALTAEVRAGALDLLARGCGHRDVDACRTLAAERDRPWVDRVGALAQGCERDAMACLDLAALLRPQIGARETEALDASCAAGSAASCHELAWRLLRDPAGAFGVPMVEDRLRRGCAAGFAASCRELATLQGQGLLGVAGEEARLATYDRACVGGSWSGCLALATLAEGRGATEVAQAFRATANGLIGVPYPEIDWKRPRRAAPGTEPVGEVLVHWSEVVPVSRTAPEYPASARAVSLEGDCVVRIRVGRDGVPDAAVARNCHRLFVGPTEAAALGWRFRPPPGTTDLVVFDLTVKYRLR